MIPLQTKVDFPSAPFTIEYHDKIVMAGSCFADNIGNKLKNGKLDTLVNPFGVNYNPASVSNTIQAILDNKEFTVSHLHKQNDLYFNYLFDTHFSNTTEKACLNTINSAISNSHQFVKSITTLSITLGTAWIYKLKSTGEIVSNCHKIPAKEFQREILSVDDCVLYLSRSIKKLIEINPQLKIILTISPIRHWKDGAIENQRSKSTLTLAVRELEREFPQLYYFPSYEFMMDELRDYRFYADDMLHPSDLAIEMIWGKFIDVFFNKPTQQLYSKIFKVQNALQHKAQNTQSTEYKKFKDYISKSINEIQQINPSINF